ncbi:hypothetical protein NSA47_01950 [Irregularibacter muris]|uniref:Uncharacterized protein n=1 Tax=Irregularibacter muris TaxID=1796619 RepID=A0AAE3KYM4_9FIRM|nr:hypothetical protein [Irregularibacter muris]MCR1897750.1 hypothetical protein [Irregularibacter muris]
MSHLRHKMKLKFLLPHILQAEWNIEEIHIKDFIKKFGYWAWEQSIPALKIDINSSSNIMGEEESFILPLEEGDEQCIFFTSYNRKVFWVEYGRKMDNEIFIPFISSDRIKDCHFKECPIMPLPKNLVHSKALMQINQYVL